MCKRQRQNDSLSLRIRTAKNCAHTLMAKSINQNVSNRGLSIEHRWPHLPEKNFDLETE